MDRAGQLPRATDHGQHQRRRRTRHAAEQLATHQRSDGSPPDGSNELHPLDAKTALSGELSYQYASASDQGQPVKTRRLRIIAHLENDDAEFDSASAHRLVLRMVATTMAEIKANGNHAWVEPCSALESMWQQYPETGKMPEPPAICMVAGEGERRLTPKDAAKVVPAGIIHTAWLHALAKGTQDNTLPVTPVNYAPNQELPELQLRVTRVTRMNNDVIVIPAPPQDVDPRHDSARRIADSRTERVQSIEMMATLQYPQECQPNEDVNVPTNVYGDIDGIQCVLFATEDNDMNAQELSYYALVPFADAAIGPKAGWSDIYGNQDRNASDHRLSETMDVLQETRKQVAAITVLEGRNAAEQKVEKYLHDIGRYLLHAADE